LGWQCRFAEKGVDVLLREPSRKPGRAPVSAAEVQRIVALTCMEPPGAVTHWTGRAMAKVVGLSLRTVQRIWEAHRLQPHRIRTVWDKRLNASYKKLLASLLPDQQKKVRASQRLWLQHWEAACNLYMEIMGGTGGRLLASSCSLQMLADRTLELEGLMFE
jgi:hypothetical protein